MAQLDRFMRATAQWLALSGGLVLIGIIATTVLSIAGRLLNGIGHSGFMAHWLPDFALVLQFFQPIVGDFELVEAGVAFAVMAFIPWCQLNRGQAKVEVLTRFLPNSANHWLALLWEFVFCAVYSLIAWRLVVGTGDKMRYGETTFMLQFPVWWAYSAVAMGAILAALVTLWSVVLYAREAMGRPPFSEPTTQAI